MAGVGDPQGMELRVAPHSEGLSQPKASKEIGTSVLQRQGTEDCQQAEGAWKCIRPQGLQTSLYHQHFDFSLVRPCAEKPAHQGF